MKILENLHVPTGNILIVEGGKGKLELLSIGDYGKEHNLKADFLNLTEEVNGVSHTKLLPLEEKWVITVSTQYGCSMNCPYCDVPKVGPGRNASVNDILGQIYAGRKLHPEVTHTKRLNIHFARMGEPSWNPSVIYTAGALKRMEEEENFIIHPVVSTMMPKNNKYLRHFIESWMRIKNQEFNGNAGLQISLNSTDEEQREYLFGGNALGLEDTAKIMEGIRPIGRKITLNIALSSNTIVDPQILLKYFNPEEYLVKITPMHETQTSKKNNLFTSEGYKSFTPYRSLEKMLKDAGYDVIVFVPSEEEDKSRITCGNAILANYG